MRYSIISKGLSLSQIEVEVLKVGGSNIKKAEFINEIFCDLDNTAVSRLSNIPGLKLRQTRVIKSDQTIVIDKEPLATQRLAVQQEVTVSDVFSEIRNYFSPSLTGVGLTVAVLDTGVRKTHEALVGKVVYEYNCTDAPSVNDVFGHGTGIAFLIAGGVDIVNKFGASPGAKIMNIKVLDDEGVGTDETIIMGINKVCSLTKVAREQGLWPTNGMYPNIINISIGAEDNGDRDDPLEVACRKAVEDYGIDVVAAAGNTGPKRSTIMEPAVAPEVVAVGGLITGGVEIAEWSSRGPTLLGDTKPDFVFWGTDIEQADNKDDKSYISKSGSSFSAPLVAGLAGLLWETGRRQYGELWLFRWSQVLEFAPYYCTKPADAAAIKDNTYGFGMPAMGTMIGQITTPTTPVTQVTEMMTPMMLMMAMLGMIGGML